MHGKALGNWQLRTYFNENALGTFSNTSNSILNILTNEDGAKFELNNSNIYDCAYSESQ